MDDERDSFEIYSFGFVIDLKRSENTTLKILAFQYISMAPQKTTDEITYMLVFN